MKIVLTGATGFLGLALGRELLKQGHEVRGLVRNLEQAREKIPYPMELFNWNTPLEALNGCDAVIHLAGESVADGRWTASRKKALRDSRISSTQILVDGVLKLREAPRVFISASAIGYYGNRGDKVLDEKSNPGNDFLARLCIDWEASSALVEDKGVRRVLLRTGVVIGPGGGALEKMIPIFKSFAGGPQGSGRQWMSWIHRDDWVHAVIHCLNNQQVSGPVNLVSPNPVINADFSGALGKALHRPSVWKVPSFALELALGEMASIILGGQRVSPDALLFSGFKFKFDRLDPAMKDAVGVHESAGLDEFRAEQWVPRPIGEVFQFFSEAKNLETITPEFLQFQILSQTSEKIEKNSEIEYQLKIHGVPVRWKTLITEWKQNEHFVDIQLKGPYKKWHHTHTFEEMKGGTLISDRVRFELPAGVLGSLIAGRFVRKDVEQVFSYRKKVIAEQFGKPGLTAQAG